MLVLPAGVELPDGPCDSELGLCFGRGDPECPQAVEGERRGTDSVQAVLDIQGVGGLSTFVGGQSAVGNGVVPFPQVLSLLCLSVQLGFAVLKKKKKGPETSLIRSLQLLSERVRFRLAVQQRGSSQGRGPRQTGRLAGPGLPPGPLAPAQHPCLPAKAGLWTFLWARACRGGPAGGRAAVQRPSFHLPFSEPHG